jgi:hypothetical protein
MSRVVLGDTFLKKTRGNNASHVNEEYIALALILSLALYLFWNGRLRTDIIEGAAVAIILAIALKATLQHGR